VSKRGGAAPWPVGHGWWDRLQELRELGWGGVAFRAWWEVRLRSGAMALQDRRPVPLRSGEHPTLASVLQRLPFDRAAAGEVLEHRVAPAELRGLLSLATEATQGRILAFGRWPADYGAPLDWHRNPVSGGRWDARVHWSKVFAGERRAGDIKLAWELGRFPHAYHVARASLVEPAQGAALQGALARQIADFGVQNPFATGIHWASGQEIAFRLMAWLFALAASGGEGPVAGAFTEVVAGLHAGATHVERHIDYALHAVYNNHALSEALLLYLAGELLPAAPDAGRVRAAALRILTAQAARQFYRDGAYIQLSHNYERVALQVLLWAVAIRRRSGEPVPKEWQEALARGSSFLDAHMNAADGRLPNYGANDGALPSLLSTCDFADFRPTLQAASIAGRGERLYPPGPWDEEAAWLLGPTALEAPQRPVGRRSVSFGETGFHVLRGKVEGSFGAFRCGTIRDRFSQIDMLHLDVWWRGQNVLVDPGSYLYNGPARWHDHFMRTASHNTVALDARDQMLHYRRFKTLYWTQARLLRFEDGSAWALAEGEHAGYARHLGGCVHRRAILYLKDDLWVVVDHLAGGGDHTARLHWLCGSFPERFDPVASELVLDTPAGAFHLAVKDCQGRPLRADVARGQEEPPRGWLSRYYAEKVAVPSLEAVAEGTLPFTFVSLLSGGPATAAVVDGRWTVETSGAAASFRLEDGRFGGISIRDGLRAST